MKKMIIPIHPFFLGKSNGCVTLPTTGECCNNNDIIREIITVRNIMTDSNKLSLQSMSAKVISTIIFNKLQSSDNVNVNAVVSFFEDKNALAPAVRKKIKKQLYNKLIKVTVENNPVMASQIAIIRVEHGQPCDKVANDHGLSRDDGKRLEVYSIFGPGKKRVKDGESCDSVCKDLVIKSSARRFLEIIAINAGPMRKELSEGKPLTDLCNKYGIVKTRAIDGLEGGILWQPDRLEHPYFL
ncbi:hypothetical protein Sant_P0228 (plasmid) [Sodalis praecaptivus]|uniref:Uncharacterized protein n=1 Tax=Sodalis praecaptivus TaxID=1239307 RepID=W0HZK5_9GAMM|nr:hypothetical protein [Sodalis praecaptivus]AHF79271.1 hypothetical protein Sant_P0228 [Sodalis praecaptivus]